MPRISRLLLAAAAVMLVGMLVFPIWRISLLAPQYPEGLGMLIRASTVEGIKPNDLSSINGLNHYIGMRPIQPDAIPELRIMPWIIAGLIAGGLAAAALGRRWMLNAWLGGFVAFAGVGLVDFWRWEYDYGHDLDLEHAIIKVPGMTYQPPLIGVKQLLNFTAASWPDVGALLAFAALALGIAALIVARRGRPTDTSRARTTADPRAGAGSRVAAVMMLLVAFAPSARGAVAQQVIDVSPTGAVRTVGDALAIATPGARIVVHTGVYREAMLVVRAPVSIEGDGDAVLDGEGARQIMLITGDDVTVRRLRFRGVGVAMTDDRAAIKVRNARRCTIEDNRVEDGFFGIYLANVTGCRIARNALTASHRTEAGSGNGIHLWTSRGVAIDSNSVRGYRDGIYFEFVHDTDVRHNVSERNLRYGLHFMYSDDCRYIENEFRRNGSGVAVMYTKHVTMTGNRFEDNEGSAAYGLLLKEIADPSLVGNRFTRNTVGLVADGAMRLDAHDNVFVDNGWAVRLMGSTTDARFTRNDFVGNSFDVATNSRRPETSFLGNYWDEYTGYDLDHDGSGDVPHRPVRLFSYLVSQNEPTLILMRSLFVAMLDGAERVLPALTPDVLVDARPAMRRTQ